MNRSDDSLPPIADDPDAIAERLWLKNHEPFLRLALVPTFTAPEIWFIFRPKRQLNPMPDPIACQISCDPANDNIEIESASIPWPEYLKMMNGLGSIGIRVFADPKSDFRDGDRLMLKTYDRLQSAEVVWPGENSDSFDDLTRWFRTTTDFLRALVIKNESR